MYEENKGNFEKSEEISGQISRNNINEIPDK